MDKSIETLLIQLEDSPNLSEILKAIAKYGIGSSRMAVESTGLSRKTCDRAIKTLSTWGLITRGQILGEIASNHRPERVHVLTRKGVQVCAKGWNLSTQALDIRDPLGLAHRYCQAQIANQAALNVTLESTIFFAPSRSVRIDVLVDRSDGHKLIIEVEQGLGRNNLPRAVQKFAGLGGLFTSLAGESVCPNVLIVFNLKESDLEATLGTWQDALALAFPDSAEVTFMVHYCTLQEFMDYPEFVNVSYFRRLQASEPKQAGIASPQKSAPLFNPAATPPVAELLNLVQRLAPEYDQQASLLVTNQDDTTRLRDFGNLAQMIYEPSFGKEGPTKVYSAFPWASLWYLEHFLHLPQNAALLKELKDGMEWIQSRQTGLVMYRDAVTRLVWDVFLRYMGMARGGPLRVYVRIPGLEDNVSDIQIDVRIDVWKNDSRLQIGYRELEFQDAIGWMLTAIFTYPADLGLVTTLWKRKNKSKKTKENHNE